MPDFSLCDPRIVSDILRRHGVRLSKGLGQNFLTDPSVPPRIAGLSLCEGKGVIEIGPGVGALTCELARLAEKVVAVELDRRLIPVLNETMVGFPNVKIINADILRLDLHRLIEEEFSGMEVCVCANLPYYITTPIIMSLLERRLPVSHITVMVQKEVAERLTAEAGSHDAGAVTYAVRYLCEPELLFDVAPTSFLPPPKVTSSVIRLTLREKPAVAVSDERLLFSLIKAAFAQRRKTLVNALAAPPLSIPKERSGEILVSLGLGRDVRGERLTLEDYAALCERLVIN